MRNIRHICNVKVISAEGCENNLSTELPTVLDDFIVILLIIIYYKGNNI